jgi:hypothetical protein
VSGPRTASRECLSEAMGGGSWKIPRSEVSSIVDRFVPAHHRLLVGRAQVSGGGILATHGTMAFVTALVAMLSFQPPVLSQQDSAGGEKRAGLISELSGAASLRKHSSAAASTVERFGPIPHGAILELGRDSSAVLVLARGKRFALGSKARVIVHADRLASMSGPVRELPALPALPRLVALDAQAPKALGGVRLRSSVVAGLSPSNAAAFATRTTLRFAAVSGAGSYRVEIEDEKGRVIFGVQTTSVEVPIPPDVLRAGAAYYWTVRTIDSTGPQARGSAAFTTVRNDDARAREELKRQLEEEGGVSSLALLAAIDRHLGLYAEALEGFRAALALAPDDAALREAVSELAARQGGGH